MSFKRAKEYLRVRLLKPITKGIAKILPTPDPSAPTTPTLGTTGQRMWAFQEKERWIILTESKKAVLIDQMKLCQYIESIRVKGKRLIDETAEPVKAHEAVYNTFYSTKSGENDAGSADPKS